MYISGIESSIKNDPKKLWNYVNSKRKPRTVIDDIKVGNINLVDSGDIANAFADFFSSVYGILPGAFIENSNNLIKMAVDFSIDPLLIPMTDISYAIQRLANKSSLDIDSISTSLIKLCPDALLLPLYLIFKNAMCKGIYPSAFKSARVCPVPKKGNDNNITNFRPVTTPSPFSKVFEICLYNIIYQFFVPFVSVSQHGFLPKRSTINNLVTITNYINKILSEGKQVDIVYTDMSKAFDKIDWVILLSKLVKLGFPKGIIKLLVSYLDNRNNVVIVNG